MRDNGKWMTLATMITRIKNEMRACDITQAELAEDIGITQASMSRYLNLRRKMPFDVVSKCMARFDMEITVRERGSEKLPPVMKYCADGETWCEYTSDNNGCKLKKCYKYLEENKHDE